MTYEVRRINCGHCWLDKTDTPQQDSAAISAAQCATRATQNLAIDPLDENYFISGTSQGEGSVSVWDKRFFSLKGPTTPSEGGPAGAVLEIKPTTDNSFASVLRFSGTKRGQIGVLTGTGELRLIETAQHASAASPQSAAINPLGGHAWTTPNYVKRSHVIRSNLTTRSRRQDDNSRVMAFDFMPNGNIFEGPHALALHRNRDVGLITIAEAPPLINFTALNELYAGTGLVAKPESVEESVAQDLLDAQKRAGALQRRRSSSGRPLDLERDVRFHSMNLEDISKKTSNGAEGHVNPSSRELHEELLTLRYPKFQPPLPDMLGFLETPKRRAKEGYALNNQRNKSVVRNDPWLKELWCQVQRFDDLARDGGMIGHGLDLSYIGVATLWSNKFPALPNTNRLLDPDIMPDHHLSKAVKEIGRYKDLPSFDTPHTKHVEHRQLCLAMCGWSMSKQKCRDQIMDLLKDSQHYKAIVLAVFKGFRDVAQDALRWAVQQGAVLNIALGAVIATDTPSDGTRTTCEWMLDETTDPYLRALLTYFITSDWRKVTDMAELPLLDRVGVALKYLDDASLSTFIKLATSEAVVYGDISGLILTGLEERAMDLFEHYIAKFSDLQTAVLVMARSNPVFVKDERWELWKETYFMQMQRWRAFIERSRFVAAHNRLAVDRVGRSVNKPTPRQITIRCNRCQVSLARRDDILFPRSSSPYLTQPSMSEVGNKQTASAGARDKTPSTSSGLVCGKCGAHMPRCGLCMMWLGSPDPANAAVADMLKGEDGEARQMVFCMTCGHGFHGHHARDWFGRHMMCPIPDCMCMCGVLK